MAAGQGIKNAQTPRDDFRRCVQQESRCFRGYRWMLICTGVGGTVGLLLPGLPARQRLNAIIASSIGGVLFDYLNVQYVCSNKTRESRQNLPALPVRKPRRSPSSRTE
ncbi:hypothetical protein AAMO2058_000632600 [Amorphochlora amoebiformis]